MEWIENEMESRLVSHSALGLTGFQVWMRCPGGSTSTWKWLTALEWAPLCSTTEQVW